MTTEAARTAIKPSWGREIETCARFLARFMWKIRPENFAQQKLATNSGLIAQELAMQIGFRLG